MGQSHRSGRRPRHALPRLPALERAQHDPASRAAKDGAHGFALQDRCVSRYNIVSEDDIREAAKRIEEGAKTAISDVIATSFPLAPNEGNEGVASKDRKPS